NTDSVKWKGRVAQPCRPVTDRIRLGGRRGDQPVTAGRPAPVEAAIHVDGNCQGCSCSSAFANPHTSNASQLREWTHAAASYRTPRRSLGHSSFEQIEAAITCCNPELPERSATPRVRFQSDTIS